MEGRNSDTDESDTSSVRASMYLERLISKDEDLDEFLCSDASSRETPMTAQQARDYAGALLANPHVKKLVLDFSCCRPEALEAFVPYIRSSEALSALSLRVDRLVQDLDYAQVAAPYREAVNQIYFAAAENAHLVKLFADITASPKAIVKLLSSSTLKTFDFGEYYIWEDYDEEPGDSAICPLVTLGQQRALAAGFSRNSSLEDVKISVQNGASALCTIITGLHRHPRLEVLRVNTCTCSTDTCTCSNDTALVNCIAQLLGSAPTLREVKFHGKRTREFLQQHTPLDISSLLCVPIEKRLESLEFSSMDISTGHSMHTEESMLSVSKVSFISCNFESSESLLVLSNLFRLEKLTIDFGGGRDNSFVGNDQSEVMGPGPIEQLVEKHKSLTEISISAPLNDQNIMDIAQSLSHFDTLEFLSLTFGSRIGIEAMNLLLSSLHNNKGLQKLCLRDPQGSFSNSLGGRALTAMLRANKSLSHVNLNRTSISEESLRGLCDGLHDNSTLKILDFPCVTGGGLSIISETLGNGSNTLEEVGVAIHGSLGRGPEKNELCTFLSSISHATGLKKLSLQHSRQMFSCRLFCFTPNHKEAALLLLKAAEMNPSLCEVKVNFFRLKSIEKKLHFQLKVNRFRRRLANFPIGLWPRVLAQMCGPDDHDVRYYFVRPEIKEWGQDQRSLRDDSKKRASVSDDDNKSPSRKKQNQGGKVGDA